jgi:hypothetical protein
VKQSWRQISPHCLHSRFVYSVQAANSKSERLFNSDGNTAKWLRNIMDAEKGENLIIFKLNMNLLKVIAKSKWCIQKNMLYVLLCSVFVLLIFWIGICFGIGLILVLLNFEKSTNTNTIPAFIMVFQYNTIRIVHLCKQAIYKYNHLLG